MVWSQTSKWGTGDAQKGLGSHNWGAPNHHQIVQTRDGAYDRTKKEKEKFFNFQRRESFIGRRPVSVVDTRELLFLYGIVFVSPNMWRFPCSHWLDWISYIGH